MRKGKQREKVLAAARAKAANKVVLLLAKMQAAFAKYMDRKINRLSAGKKKALFYGFCFIGSLCCFYLIVSPFAVQKKKNVVTVDPIEFSKPQPRKRPSDAGNFISPEEYSRIHAFKLYLDSLCSDKDGRGTYDSIVAVHPGLMDTLKLIEEYYQIQK